MYAFVSHKNLRFFPNIKSCWLNYYQKKFFLQNSISPKVVQSEIAYICLWVNYPDECTEAGGCLTDAHVPNQLTRVDSKFRVVENHQCDYSWTAYGHNSDSRVEPIDHAVLLDGVVIARFQFIPSQDERDEGGERRGGFVMVCDEGQHCCVQGL